MHTTAREDSYLTEVPAGLALRWVWPSARLDWLQGAKLSIGRDPEASIRLEGSGISRLHAELYRQGPLYVVRDLGSTNGTWLAGQRVEHAPVAPGGVLRIGDWVGVFVLAQADAPAFAELAPDLFGGPELAGVLAPLKRAATSSVPVLIVGDTGSGKERFARAAHYLSGRSGPFVAVNCAALPEQLAEAELFGYRRGAFTGAERASTGHFRVAHGGTLFLDEMPELSASLQAKLLRVVEDGQVQSLGEPAPTPVDVRIVSATQAPLPDLVAKRKLREDLAARLTGLVLTLPPLRARRGDVAALFNQFLKRQTGGRPPLVEARLIEALCLHDWPQNVRELELLTRTLLAVHGHEAKLRRQHLPPQLSALCDDAGPSPKPTGPPRERRDHDLQKVKRELRLNGGNVKAAAESLGLSRQRIYRLLEGDTDDSGSSGEEADGAGS